ncbi:MAG TPA: hypothetical protein VII96_06515 [Acidimicrobiales bacterium]
MRTNRLHRPLSRLVAGATVVGSTAVLLAGALAVPAGAVTGAPYTTKVTVTSNGAVLQTGQPASFTAKVVATGHGTPGGQVLFTVTGADSSVASCDAGNTATLVSGAASCTVSAGLLAASGPYTVQAAYTDTVDSTYKPGTGSRVQTVNVGGTTTTLSSSINPSVTGQGISLNAVVAAATPAAGSPTGSVTFSGVTCDGGSNTFALSSGQAQCQIAGGLVGQTAAYLVSGSYSGDTQFAGSSGKFKQLVKPAATTVTLVPTAGTCTGDVCTVGQGTSLSFVATAAASGTDGGSGTPTGTITFSITRPGSNISFACDGGTNTMSLDNTGKATCNVAAGLPAIVYYKVSATLSSPGYSPSVGTLFENSALSSTNTTTSVPKNVGTGQTFDVTAVVTPTTGYAGSNAPTGYVNILVCGANSNGNNGCQGGAAPVGPGGVASLTIGGGEFIGVYSYQAVYTGDSNFYSSTAKSKFIFIGKSPTAVSLSEPGGFFSADGAAVAITATVVATNGAAGSTLIGPPSGNVTFTITGPSGPVTCDGGNTIALPINPGQIEGSVTCFLPPGTLTDSTPPATSYVVHVNYAGDSDYVSSNDRAVQVVAPAAI